MTSGATAQCKPVAMQYKANDSGVDLFAVGTAAGHV